MTIFPSNCYLKFFNGVVAKIQFQSVRNRKPSWLPRAKSKMFKIPPRSVIPIEETDELKRLHNHYRTHVKSIRTYLATQWQEETEQTIDHEAEKLKLEADFQNSLLINKEWAEQLMPVREKFFADQLKNNLDLALNTIENERISSEEHLAKVEEIVREIKEISKDFITADNIDRAIDNALENVTDYNYALNLKGEKVLKSKSSVQV